jgi:hypothetical protein
LEKNSYFIGKRGFNLVRDTRELKQNKISMANIDHYWVDIGLVILDGFFVLKTEKFSFGDVQYRELGFTPPTNLSIDRCIYIKETPIITKDLVIKNYAEIYNRFCAIHPNTHSMVLYFNNRINNILGESY